MSWWRRDAANPGKIGRVAQCKEFGHWWGEERVVTVPTIVGHYEVDMQWRVRECRTCPARDQRLIESSRGSFVP